MDSLTHLIDDYLTQLTGTSSASCSTPLPLSDRPSSRGTLIVDWDGTSTPIWRYSGERDEDEDCEYKQSGWEELERFEHVVEEQQVPERVGFASPIVRRKPVPVSRSHSRPRCRGSGTRDSRGGIGGEYTCDSESARNQAGYRRTYPHSTNPESHSTSIHSSSPHTKTLNRLSGHIPLPRKPLPQLTRRSSTTSRISAWLDGVALEARGGDTDTPPSLSSTISTASTTHTRHSLYGADPEFPGYTWSFDVNTQTLHVHRSPDEGESEVLSEYFRVENGGRCVRGKGKGYRDVDVNKKLPKLPPTLRRRDSVRRFLKVVVGKLEQSGWVGKEK
ncbi:hypothetical protein M011DRAFT_457642 [Sporormia fimetaria CBS 119925]|uniref:Uncharacterized protein n=1 Tax=Sporormia fimetaria CBS 119925 TaxID=1340428 RepID=A0A6A6VCE5_9PLEO|nr:hypothetical protein M011DRAFT_457642 [Sporormia fimetaria CBS 119925]